jgi:replicative DNA helicase
MIYSLQVERHALSGLLKFPEIFVEVDGFVTETDFYNEVHSTIFLVIKSTIYKNEKVDRVIIASKIKDLGISFKDDINIFDYIETLYLSQINKEAVVKSFKELIKYRVRREIASTGSKLIEEVKNIGEKSLEEIVSSCDSIYNKKISVYSNTEMPEKITDEISDLIEERGNSPESESGLLSPYSEFNRMYGGFRAGHVYAIASRPGEGKTSWINDVCFKSASQNKVKALILDTEMQTKEIKFRMAAALTGVPVWYLETGNWRKNPEMFKKVRECSLLKEDKDYYHYHVSNKSIDEICSIIKRWYYNKVGRGNPCIVAYDYVKLTGEKVSANWAEHQAIGEKINKLKEISVEVNAPLITAMQLNRSGENRNKASSNLIDDASAISLSDRLQWYAAFTAIFRRKTLDEIELDGQDFGTHKMIPLKSRFQGKDAMGHQDYIRRRFPDGSEKYVMNYLNFEVNNFNIIEKGSLRHVCERAKEMYSLKENGGKEDDGSLE